MLLSRESFFLRSRDDAAVSRTLDVVRRDAATPDVNLVPAVLDAVKARATVGEVMNALGVDAMTAHWEFTYGAKRVEELVRQLKFPFLAGNVKEKNWGDQVFEPSNIFAPGDLSVAVIGQAFPYTPIANPRYLIPDWSFGIEEKKLADKVVSLRDSGVDLVILLSHNGFDVDRKLAARVKGIDVILTGHTHDALPHVVKVGDTLLVAAGSHGKFLARLDLEVKEQKVVDYAFRLIPVLADAITPDPDMAALIREIRQPHDDVLGKVLGTTESVLYRRGNFNGTFDDLICQALIAERDVEIALSPGFRWGSSLLPGQPITGDDLFNQTAITYPNAYRTEMTGAYLKDVLEDVADNLFNPDPYYQQGGDMVRAGGLAYTIDVAKPMGQRISDLTLLRTGEKIDAARKYTVSGWASINENTEGPPVYDVVARHLARTKTVRLEPNRHVRVLGADAAGME